jgi:hypothetical protein
LRIRYHTIACNPGPSECLLYLPPRRVNGFGVTRAEELLPSPPDRLHRACNMCRPSGKPMAAPRAGLVTRAKERKVRTRTGSLADAAPSATSAETIEHPIPFVGREFELRCLENALRAAATGDGGMIVVAGSPGPGKTRLAAELPVAHRMKASAGLLCVLLLARQIPAQAPCWSSTR